jgi:hypothetical protein
MDNINKPSLNRQWADRPSDEPDNEKANFDLHEILSSRPGVKPKVLEEAHLPAQLETPSKSKADELRESFPNIISSPFITKDSKDGLSEAEKEAIAKRHRKPVKDNFTGK